MYIHTYFLDVQQWDYFKTCIYTPYTRHQGWWQPNNVPYISIYSYFSGKSWEQQLFYTINGTDQILSTAFSSLPNLTTVELHFVSGIDSPFEMFSAKVIVDWYDCFPDYLKMVARAIIAAREKNMFTIHAFKVAGFCSSIESDQELLFLLKNLNCELYISS